MAIAWNQTEAWLQLGCQFAGAGAAKGAVLQQHQAITGTKGRSAGFTEGLGGFCAIAAIEAAEVEALPGWIYHLVNKLLDCPIQGGLIVPPVEMDGHLCSIWITRSSPKASPESRLG